MCVGGWGGGWCGDGGWGASRGKLKTEGLKKMKEGMKDVDGGNKWSQLVKGKEGNGNYGEKGRRL